MLVFRYMQCVSLKTYTHPAITWNAHLSSHTYISCLHQIHDIVLFWNLEVMHYPQANDGTTLDRFIPENPCQPTQDGTC